MPILAEDYAQGIRQRSSLRFWLGFAVRLRNYLRHEWIRRVARKNGAVIGKNVVMPLALAKRANANLIVGDDTSIASDDFELREPIKIGTHVIIGRNVKLMTRSHNIDSIYWESVGNGGLFIDDYVWCATDVSILPGCRYIGRGSIIGAGAVVVKDVAAMAVMGGNPAKLLRQRKAIHTALVVPSVNGGDFVAYWKAKK